MKYIIRIGKITTFTVLVSMLGFIFLEVAFRALLGIGWVKTVTETYSGDPYGFYFWSREGGHPRGVNNRFTYADHDYDVENVVDNTVVVIGDSFVEALQVDIDKKMGPLLQSLMNDQEETQHIVMSFGRSGQSPAHYLEQYKGLNDMFLPKATFVYIFMGNDFRNLAPQIQQSMSGQAADKYITYYLDPVSKEVKLDPLSIQLVKDMRSGVVNNFRIRASYQLNSKQKINTFFLNNFLIYSEVPYRLSLLKKNLDILPVTISNEENRHLKVIKKDDCDSYTIFLRSHSTCWLESKAVMNYIMGEFRKNQEASGTQLYFIGIPANETYWADKDIDRIVTSHKATIPLKSFDQYLAKNYSTTIADVDLKLPNKMLMDIMKEQGLYYVDMHDRFYKAIVEGKQQVYCQWVIGHLCEEGHRIVAEEMMNILNVAMDMENQQVTGEMYSPLR